MNQITIKISDYIETTARQAEGTCLSFRLGFASATLPVAVHHFCELAEEGTELNGEGKKRLVADALGRFYEAIIWPTFAHCHELTSGADERFSLLASIWIDAEVDRMNKDSA